MYDASMNGSLTAAAAVRGGSSEKVAAKLTAAPLFAPAQRSAA